MRRNEIKNGTAQSYLPRLIAALCVLNLAACDDDQIEKNPIILSPIPQSVSVGDKVEIELTSEEDFFEKSSSFEKNNKDIETVKKRILDSKKAIVELISKSNTRPGLYEIHMKTGGRKAQFTISILNKTAGPGTILIEGNRGSSGAKHGYIKITGDGTSFDDSCEVESNTENGFKIERLEIESLSEAYIFYSIDIEQEPGDISLSLIDGDYSYDIPFEIVSAKEYQNDIPLQVISEGRIQNIHLANSEATFLFSTSFEKEYESIETGRTTVHENQYATIPVRVPVQSNLNELELTEKTYLEGGAFLETLDVKVEIAPPGYWYLEAPRLESVEGRHKRKFYTHNFEIEDIKRLYVVDESEKVNILKWDRESDYEGTVELILEEGYHPGPYDLVAEIEGTLEYITVITVSDQTKNIAYVPNVKIAPGDEIYIPIVVEGGDLSSDSLEIESDNNISLKVIDFLGPDLVMANLKIEKGSVPRQRTIVLRGEKHNYDIKIDIVDSGFNCNGK